MLLYQGRQASEAEAHGDEDVDEVSQAYSCIRYVILQLTIHV